MKPLQKTLIVALLVLTAFSGSAQRLTADAPELSEILHDRGLMEAFVATNSEAAPWMRNALAAGYRNSGRITPALAHWSEVWQQWKDAKDVALRSEADHAMAGQLELLSSLGRVDLMHDLLKSADGREIDSAEDRRRIETAREAYAIMVDHPTLSYRCGSLALANIARSQGKPADIINALIEEPSTDHGISLHRLAELSKKFDLGLIPVKRTDATPIPVPAVIHWSQNHYGAVLDYRPDLQCYRIVDPTFRESKWVSAADLDAEASGYFLVTRIPAGWRTVDEEETKIVYGRGYPYNINDSKDRGCPKPCIPCQNKPAKPPHGMPQWFVTEPYINLWLADEPVAYNTSRGEDFGFQITVKQRDSLGTIFAYPRPGFLHNWYSRIYIQGMPTSNNPTNSFASWTATVDLPTGGQVTFTSDSMSDEQTGMKLQPTYGTLTDGTTYVVPGLPLGSNNVPSVNAWYDSVSGFRIFYPDGSVDRYGLIYWRTNVSAGYYDCEALLTTRSDPDGNDTTLSYESYTSSGQTYYRLTQVVDYDGKTNILSYYSTNPGLLQQVTTPYNQTASFTYDSQTNLASITDAISLTNSLKWDTNGQVTTLVTPYGTNSFYYYQVPTPDPQGAEGNLGGHNRVNRAITVVDAGGGTNIYAYRFDCSGFMTPAFAGGDIPQGTPMGSLDTGATNASTTYAAASFRNSFHWGPRQCATLSTTVVTNFLSGDYLKAEMKHWLGDSNNVTVMGLLSVEREFSPDGTTEGQTTFYDYAGKTLGYLQGTNSQISVTARIQPSGNTEYYWRQYNADEFVTREISTYTLADGVVRTRTNSYAYATNTISFRMQATCSGCFAGIPQLNGCSQAPVASSALVDTVGAYKLNTVNTSKVSWASLLITATNTDQSSRHYGAYTGLSSSDNVTCGGWTEATTKDYSRPMPGKFTNEVSYVTTFTFTSDNQISGVTTPAGLTTTNRFDSTGHLTNVVDIQLNRTNSFTYTNGLVYTWKNERGMLVTNTWDKLQRLVSRADQGGYISNVYSRLDLSASRDKLGNWTYFGYDPLRHLVAVTNANQAVSQASYCSCGSLTSLTDATLTNSVNFNYDQAGRLTNIVYPDGYSVTNTYNSLDQVVKVSDGMGYTAKNYNLQGLFTSATNAVGTLLSISYDIRDRQVAVIDQDNVSITNGFDSLGRIVNRTGPDGVAEGYVYSLRGLAFYTNRDAQITRYGRDEAGRLTAITNANNEVTQFQYDPSSNLTNLLDGLNHTTSWQFNQFDWLTNKLDGLGHATLQYSYNANGWVTNRFTPEKGNTGYTYDNVGNLKAINYPQSSINYSYDALNRLTNMADAVGTTAFAYTPVGQMASETGPWADDAMSYTYSQRLRVALSLSEPSGSWSQTYGYDSLSRMTNLVSLAGTFTYILGGASTASPLIKELLLPNAANITNSYDSLARLTKTAFNNYWGHTLDGYSYQPDPLDLRTNITRNFGLTNSSVSVGYDLIGQLTSWGAKEPNGAARLNEQLSFGYDAAHNLHSRSRNGFTQTFNIDAANELTNVTRNSSLTFSGAIPAPATNITVNGQTAQIYSDLTFAGTNNTLANGTNTFTIVAQNVYGLATTNTLTANLPTNVALGFDNNGNLTNDGSQTFQYDAENQLTNIMVAGQWRSDFVYDGLNRRRITRDYSWNGTWVETNEVRYIYDGRLVIQERDANNNVLVTYTRGRDLSGGLQGAGGIGGLLARTDGNGSTFYHADGNGNITALMDNKQNIVARYEYDPFGNTLAMSGKNANANPYRFSSKEIHLNSGLYYYGRRYYEPGFQRWINRDPDGESGGNNLYNFVWNGPINGIDSSGLGVIGTVGGWLAKGGDFLLSPVSSGVDGMINANGVMAMNQQLANANYTSMQDFNLNRPHANLNCVVTTAGDTSPYAVMGQLLPAALALETSIMPQLAAEGDLGGALAGDFANGAPELVEDAAAAGSVWNLAPIDRGNAIEDALAATEYAEWYRVGAENDGYFPLVDFQQGNNLVSLKTVDTGGSTWMGRMQAHIADLGTSGAMVDNVPANLILDIRVQPGGAGAAQSLINYGQNYGVTVLIKEFP